MVKEIYKKIIYVAKKDRALIAILFSYKHLKLINDKLAFSSLKKNNRLTNHMDRFVKIESYSIYTYIYISSIMHETYLMNLYINNYLLSKIVYC